MDNREARQAERPSGAEVHSFNNVTEHYRTVLGIPDKAADLSSMPKPLRWFGYFFYSAIVLFAALFAFTILYEKLK